MEEEFNEPKEVVEPVKKEAPQNITFPSTRFSVTSVKGEYVFEFLSPEGIPLNIAIQACSDIRDLMVRMQERDQLIKAMAKQEEEKRNAEAVAQEKPAYETTPVTEEHHGETHV